MKNKQVGKDERGYRWFITKKGVIQPANWKQQCYLASAKANNEEKQNKLYKKGK